MESDTKWFNDLLGPDDIDYEPEDPDNAYDIYRERDWDLA